MLVTELIKRGAHQFGSRTAILFEDQRLTFTEADRLAAQIANTLLGPCQAAPGERIGLFLGNSLYGIPVDFACAKAGLIRVPLNSRLAQAEHVHMLITAKVRLLIHGAEYTSRAQALQAAIPGLRRFCLEDDLLPLADSASAADPDILHKPEAPVLALFTSGTSGKLQAAVHTQSSWAAVALNILANLIDFQPGDTMLHAASMIHASGTFILPCWVRGATAAILPGFDPPEYLEAIARWRPTACNLVPTMLAMLLDHPGIEQADLSSLRSIVYGASPMPRPVIARALALWGPRFVQYYGQTEAPLCIASLSGADHLDPVRQLSCGRPAVECELRLIDEPGNDVAKGEVGEIAVRAPFTMQGYLDAPELNANSFLPGGWLRTRDLGRTDAEGYLYLVDRTSDMIITGGYNVYAREVEDALGAHPAIREVAVVGLPHDKWGEAVTAFVVLRDTPGASAQELIEYARGFVAGYKVPKQVLFIDAIPKSAVGKPLRRVLREPYWHGHERRL